jgi:hypothetical protein
VDAGAREAGAAAAALLDAAEGWLRLQAVRDPRLPSDVQTTADGLTYAELAALLAPHSGAVRAVLARNAPHAVLGLSKAIRRLPNPRYVSRTSGDTPTACHHLFDRADALRHTAARWGGLAARTAATTFASQVGELRDERYLVAALLAGDAGERLVAAAALAFTAGDAGREALRRAAAEDPLPGVRERALWAYGFAGSPDALTALADAAARDSSERVRQFARAALAAGERAWWRV